jgi:hypothetical protein
MNLEQFDKSEIKRLYGIFNYPIYTKEQKERARNDIRTELESYGYKVNVSVDKDNRFWSFRSRKNYNIETECQNPEILITAHYDTVGKAKSRCNTYLARRRGNLGKNTVNAIYQILSAIGIALAWIPLAIGIQMSSIYIFGKNIFGSLDVVQMLQDASISLYIPVLIWCVWFWFPRGKRNCYFADDNISGIVGVLALSKQLKRNGANNIRFVFFDNEEKGLCGSHSYLRERTLTKDIKVINLDTIGRGSNICIMSEKENPLADKFYRTLEALNIRFISRKRSYSDCKNFAKKGYNAVTLERCDRLTHKGKEYVDVSWIHSVDDTVSNIDFGRLVEVISIANGMILEGFIDEFEQKPSIESISEN